MPFEGSGGLPAFCSDDSVPAPSAAFDAAMMHHVYSPPRPPSSLKYTGKMEFNVYSKRKKGESHAINCGAGANPANDGDGTETYW